MARQNPCGRLGSIASYLMRDNFLIDTWVNFRVGLYCPEGSAAPKYVDIGYYSVSAGFNPNFNISKDTENFLPSTLPKDVATRIAQQICPLGYFCKDALISPCPVGRYADKLGTIDPECSLCDPGKKTKK